MQSNKCLQGSINRSMKEFLLEHFLRVPEFLSHSLSILFRYLERILLFWNVMRKNICFRTISHKLFGHNSLLCTFFVICYFYMLWVLGSKIYSKQVVRYKRTNFHGIVFYCLNVYTSSLIWIWKTHEVKRFYLNPL